MSMSQRLDQVLERMFDWFTGLPRQEAAELRADIMEAVMLKIAPLLLSSVGIFLMTGMAFQLTRAPWALGWGIVNAALFLARLVAIARAGRVASLRVARRISSLSILAFVGFGIGCVGCFAIGDPTLRVMAVISVMATATAMATRWAGLPRLAVPAILAYSLPFAFVIARSDIHHAGLLAMQFLIVTAGSITLARQTRKGLITTLRAQRLAQHMAATDPLTGIGNRAAFEQATAAMRPGFPFGLVSVDLDRFKAVNDTFGHLVGDKVLCEVARRLIVAADGHPVFRMGGDEFIILITDGDDLAAVADAVRREVRQPMPGLAPIALHMTTSVGTGQGVAGPDCLDLILHQADEELYSTKRARARSSPEPIPPAWSGTTMRPRSFRSHDRRA